MKRFCSIAVVMFLLCLTAQAWAVPSKPTMTYETNKLNITVTWTEVPDATGYTLYYAAYPYTNGDPIGSLDRGSNTSYSIELWEGASYYIAVDAYNDQGSSGYSNIELFTIISEPISSTYLDPQTGMEFVLVPEGCYAMGDNFNEGLSDELPVHEVCVDAFYIGKYEVTQGQWEAVMGYNPSYSYLCGTNCPVEQVSWENVQDFVTRLNASEPLGFRLPTEAEWEYAARSRGQLQRYSGTSDDGQLPNYAWFDIDDSADSQSFPVGQKMPNELGVYDMSGNVWEWVGDWYDTYPETSQRNPTGPATDPGLGYHLVRGGAAGNPAEASRAACRDVFAGDTASNVGFRLVIPAKAVTNGVGQVVDPRDVDNDADGFTENQGDCNDSDSLIYQGAKEICGDGVDQDCSGRDLACASNASSCTIPNNVNMPVTSCIEGPFSSQDAAACPSFGGSYYRTSCNIGFVGACYKGEYYTYYGTDNSSGLDDQTFYNILSGSCVSEGGTWNTP